MELKRKPCKDSSLSTNLLIVPYGIETRNSWGGVGNAWLLIVPYGIETCVPPRKQDTIFSPSNRTLWNWNGGVDSVGIFSKTSNRTLWNWNYHRQPVRKQHKPSNRTLWNWNSGKGEKHRKTEKLLIVPYGIETRSRQLHVLSIQGF